MSAWIGILGGEYRLALGRSKPSRFFTPAKRRAGYVAVQLMTAPRLDKEKARRAAAHPLRPGEECRAEPGVWTPRVDRTKCEGKRDCVEVCPYDVFEVRRIDDADFAALGFFAKMKSRAHGRLTAYTPGGDRCQACGLCVVACPEKAIRLEKV